jgi:hypothetical protein
MIGDAYFEVRSQVGTTLFSLLRLAAETNASPGALAELRAAVLGAIETPLRHVSGEFYAEVRRPLDGRLTAHAAGRHRHEPLLARIQQLEETFTRIARDLKSGGLPLQGASS